MIGNKAKNRELEPFHIPDIAGKYDTSHFTSKNMEKLGDIEYIDKPPTVDEYFQNDAKSFSNSANSKPLGDFRFHKINKFYIYVLLSF